MLPFAKLPVMFALLWWAPLAVAQGTLGALLDAGARKLSQEEFKLEIVQRMVVGPTNSGGNIEVMYARNGQVQGTGTAPTATTLVPVTGEWRIDDNGRICATIRIFSGSGGSARQNATLPSRCQFWFRLGDTYFVSDSDWDRSGKVLSRRVKQ